MTNSSIIEGFSIVADKLANVSIDTARQGGIWTFVLFFLAFIGLAAISYSVFNNVFKGVSLFFYGVVFIPMIFIVSIFNKKKRKERLKEWGEIKENFSGKNIPRWKWWGFLILKIGVPPSASRIWQLHSLQKTHKLC